MTWQTWAIFMAREPRFLVATNRIAGGLLVGAGAGLALAAGGEKP